MKKRVVTLPDKEIGGGQRRSRDRQRKNKNAIINNVRSYTLPVKKIQREKHTGRKELHT